MTSLAASFTTPGLLRQARNSAMLLLVLGLLFSLPVAAKTWSAHGALPGLLTALLVIALVFLGPVSFPIASKANIAFVDLAAIAGNLEVRLALSAGLILVLFWFRSVLVDPQRTLPYLPVTGWAAIGAYFCISLVFTHAT